MTNIIELNEDQIKEYKKELKREDYYTFRISMDDILDDFDEYSIKRFTLTAWCYLDGEVCVGLINGIYEPYFTHRTLVEWDLDDQSELVLAEIAWTACEHFTEGPYVIDDLFNKEYLNESILTEKSREPKGLSVVGITWIKVSEKARGLGIGSRMINALEKWIASFHNCYDTMFSVQAHPLSNKAKDKEKFYNFYKKLGYEYVEQNEDCPIKEQWDGMIKLIED